MVVLVFLILHSDRFEFLSTEVIHNIFEFILVILFDNKFEIHTTTDDLGSEIGHLLDIHLGFDVLKLLDVVAPVEVLEPLYLHFDQ